MLLMAAKFGRYDFATLKPIGLALEYINLGTRLHFQIVSREQGAVSRGDLDLVEGDHCFAQALTAVAPLKDNQVVGTLARALVHVTEGRTYMVPETLPLDQALGEYHDVLRKRCALYEAACELAGQVAGIGPAVTGVLKEYAVRIGLAYEARRRPEVARKELSQLVLLAKGALIDLPPALDYQDFTELADAAQE